MVGASPASADTTLCSGNAYSTCTNAGYTDHGYGANNGISYWGAYAGHNCTNYVAYVEATVNGASTPGYLLGNGSDWDDNASAHGVLVNGAPAHGAVAQWNVSTAHPAGHVAYVESVNADGSITVSQDNWPSGPFGWQTLSAGSSSWPNNFIHFKDLAGGSWGGVGNAMFLGTDRLNAGQSLGINHYIESSDGRFVLFLQPDGNLVLYNGSVIWNTGTGTATRLVMQTDGNLVLYNGNTPLWYTGAGGSNNRLVMQTDGNLVEYSSGNTPLWYTGTGGHAATTAFGSDSLTAGGQLGSQQYIQSSDKRYTLLLQSDGNLVLYGPGYHVLWQAGTNNMTRLVMQTDGNLVGYNVNTPVWNRSTSNGTRLVIQSDGNLVEYNVNTPLWFTGTGGQI